MNVRFHTNLDEAQRFLSQTFRAIDGWTQPPPVGARISFELRNHSTFDLEVVGLRYAADGTSVDVELHIPRIDQRSIAEWSAWLRRRTEGE